jgi:hypothetical protein
MYSYTKKTHLTATTVIFVVAVFVEKLQTTNTAGTTTAMLIVGIAISLY